MIVKTLERNLYMCPNKISQIMSIIKQVAGVPVRSRIMSRILCRIFISLKLNSKFSGRMKILNLSK